MAFFIPWRVVAEESGAAHFGFGGAMLLDLPGPAPVYQGQYDPKALFNALQVFVCK
jgi:hypothetical protein